MATQQMQSQGMFGPLPYEVQQMQQRQGMADDMAYAQMSPEQQATYGAATGGRSL